MKKTFIKTKKAFSLIEVLIVLTIITVLAAVTLSSLGDSQKGQVFINLFGETRSIFSNARSMAVTGMGQLDYTGMNEGSEYVTPAHYGLAFLSYNETQKIILFADIHPPKNDASGKNGKYNHNDVQTDEKFKEGYDKQIRTLILPKGYEFSFFSVDNTDAAIELNDINFQDGNTKAIFFTPLYADISTQGFDLNKDNPFFIIRLKEISPPNRCGQIKIHYLAGIPEVENC